MVLVVPAVNSAMLLNNPPEIPTIEGPPKGKAGIEYEYRFCSSDPDGDDIYLCFDWGDGSGEICVGPFPSGTCITEKHTWTTDGTYTIKCKAQDVYQAESDYGTLDVEMPHVYFRPFVFQTILELIYQRILNLLTLLG